ncbi:MAG: hypothetical protein PUC26_05810 [Eubacteriales bacterium]|nr:hypothetical protein [Eubacteriales bacterium]
MHAEEFLLQYKKAKSSIDTLAAEIEELESILTSGSGFPDKERVQSSVKLDREKILAEIVDLQKELLALKRDAAEKMRKVACVIDQVEPPELSRLLHMRYIEHMQWECIAADLGYTTRHVRRLRICAMEQVGGIVKKYESLLT